MSPVSATYWGLPGYVIFWALFAIAFGLFLQRAYLLYRLMRLGGPENRFDRKGRRFKEMVLEVVPQWCTLKTLSREDRAGLAHALLFWSFSLFFLSYIIFVGLAGGFGLSEYIERTPFETFYFSILDLAALLVTLTLIVAAIRRYVIRPPRLEPTAEAGVILMMVFSLMALHVLSVGFDHASRGVQASWPPLGSALAHYLSGTGLSKASLESGYRLMWWLHYLVILSFMVYIPRSKHLHILASIANAFFKPLDTKVDLRPIPLEALEAAEGTATLGASKIQDFTWKDLLDLYACAECGRCHVNCPAQLTGKTLSPREVIHHLKEHLLESGPALLSQKAGSTAEPSAETSAKAMIGEVVKEEEIWACTTCGACQEVCPVSIEHIRKIIDMRRNLVMEQSRMPESAQLMLRNMQQRGHPWAGLQSMRLRGDWTSEAEVRVLGDGEEAKTLFWVGCTGALVERNVKATLAMTRVLRAAGVDFAVLGDGETCCGDPARRAGYEFQFQMMAEQNIEVFKSHAVEEIITTCPHCYHTMKHEYPKFGGAFKVLHYTELLADLIRQGRLRLSPKGLPTTLTYHDPCYLGRYNGLYTEPRQILRSITGGHLREMARSRQTGFCCGGGGGLMWIEEQPGTTKINQTRLEDIVKTGAEAVVAACPYCLQMFEDAINHKGIQNALKAMDLVEVVEEAMRS
ncbi:MAG: (Fe-S)-binding protein [Desulfobacterota bacterium]|nr:(Fe-S)-binding protein [Thermodesulfobacteriota bacterium]